MPSLIPTFEYDIFISYRHNDNLDGWVSDFVQNLEKELRGTLKEPLTIYFPARPAGGDKNPHVGLPIAIGIETHNVDKSLEGKLKWFISPSFNRLLPNVIAPSWVPSVKQLPMISCNFTFTFWILNY